MDDATDEESPQSEQVYAANVKRCNLTFWNDIMGDIHLLGSNLHVIWLCPMFKVKFTSILLWIHNFRTPKLPLLKIFLTPPPLVSNCQHLVYPPSPPCQLLSAIGLPPLPPSSAFVSICRTPPPLPADVICEQPLKRPRIVHWLLQSHISPFAKIV